MVRPLLDHGLQEVRNPLRKQIKDTVKLGQWLDQVRQQVLEQLDLFMSVQGNEAAEDERKEQLDTLLSRCHVNLAVDNAGLQTAPVLIEDNPQLRSLFGSIEVQAEDDAVQADFSHIHAGSLLKAHGGFLLLHLRDLLGNESLWERLRRFLRCSRLQIEELGSSHGIQATAALQPEAVDVQVKFVLVGSIEEYYALQEGDPEVARRFRVKVDFAESFSASAQTYQASAVFVAHTCKKRGLPHSGPDAVALLHEFHYRLCHITVLDPACGSGNFLYVALEHIKRLEGEVLDMLHHTFQQTSRLEGEGLTVDPHQFLGLELNPRAAAMAELVLWIGYLQWHFRTHGHAQPPQPVLRDFKNIECRDAVLSWSQIDPLLDANGQPCSRWDGKTWKTHPVTGERVPDDSARLPLYRYQHPRPADWPRKSPPGAPRAAAEPGPAPGPGRFTPACRMCAALLTSAPLQTPSGSQA